MKADTKTGVAPVDSDANAIKKAPAAAPPTA